jgi:hypothetical protein
MQRLKIERPAAPELLKIKMFSKALLFSIAVTITHALPTGSPFCEITGNNLRRFESIHSKETDAKTTGFAAEFTADGLGYKITLSKENTPIHGLLMYVTDASGKHIGQFTEKTGFQFKEDCGGSKSTITHENSSEKKDTEFSWTPPTDHKGPFHLTAIVSGDKTPWTEIKIKAEKDSNALKDSKKSEKKEQQSHFADMGLPDFLKLESEAAAEQAVVTQDNQQAVFAEPKEEEDKKESVVTQDNQKAVFAEPKEEEDKQESVVTQDKHEEDKKESVDTQHKEEEDKKESVVTTGQEKAVKKDSHPASEKKPVDVANHDKNIDGNGKKHRESNKKSAATETEELDATETANFEIYFNKGESHGPMFMIASFMLYGLF